MKIIANNISIGNILEYKGKLWRVAKLSHTQPGKGGAFIQAEMKDILSGTKLNERFRSSENVERITLEENEMQFLFKEGDVYTFMDNTNYEQIELNSETIGDQRVWLQESMIVTVAFHEEKPLSVTLPKHVTMEVIEAEGSIKGQTVTSSYKTSKAENGQTVMVPQFVEAGEKIVINTNDGTYVERA
ncbi:MAG: elongation factor P [Proteobacteria bacterium]|nr:elongation factor P [Pseudomonadota bacterium]